MSADMRYNALLVDSAQAGQATRRVVRRELSDLPAGDVLVRVDYSSLNYKDALSASGNRGVTRVYPHVPGIDGAGEVIESAVDEFQPGDGVLFAAAGELGVNAPGGFGRYVRGPASEFVRLPAGMLARESMAYGTAGFTAALSVARLLAAGVKPGQGEVLVTGATGGVGCIAVAILKREGFQVVAATGKPEQQGLLTRLGAARVIQRDQVNDNSGRAMLHAQWAGVVDTVGGNFLATAIRSTLPGGAVTACGNTASPDLPLTVFPFILRGVSLLGIDALLPLKAEREALWYKLAVGWRVKILEELIHEVTLDALEPEIERILRGGQTGRVVVRLA